MGTVATSGIAATRVEIRDGRQNGPVIASLSKTGPEVWTVPSGTTLTSAQYADYNAGLLYVDVHDANGPRVFRAPLKR
jgi:CHRD domain